MNADSAGVEIPELLADAMLGKLARWLRLLGYDVRYMQDDDAVIAHTARAEGRILLTRDHRLSERRGLHTVFVQSDRLTDQLTQVVEAVGCLPSETPQRCMACNVALVAISVEVARSGVPAYVVETVGSSSVRPFHQCPECGKIYWKGTHWQGIEDQLDEALKDGAVRRMAYKHRT
jgi:uncharacterized protein with PIN domain